MSLALRSYLPPRLKGQKPGMVPCGYPCQFPGSLNSQRQADPWGPLTWQPNLIDEFRPVRDPVSKAQGAQCPLNWSCDLDMHTHSCTHTNEDSTRAGTYAYACTYTPTPTPTKLQCILSLGLYWTSLLFLPVATLLPSIQDYL